jgi:hypothetical protein
MARQTMVSYLAFPTPVSPLRETLSHPSYLERSQGLVREALNSLDLSPKLRAMLEFTQAYLERIEGFSRSRVAELNLRDEVGGIAFDETGLVVFERGNRTIARVPYGKIERAAGRRERVAIPEDARTVTVPPGIQLWGGIWCAPGLGILSVGESLDGAVIDPAFRSVRSWRSLQADLSSYLKTSIRAVWFPSTPSRFAALATGAVQTSDLVIHSLANFRLHGSKRWLELTSEAAGMGLKESIVMQVSRAVLVGSRLYLPLIEGMSNTFARLDGFAVLDLDSLRLVRLAHLELPPPLDHQTGSNQLLDPETGARQLTVVSSTKGDRFMMVNLARAASNRQAMAGLGQSLQVLEVFEDRRPTSLGTNELLVNRLHRLPLTDIESLSLNPTLAWESVVTAPGVLLASVENDSTYRLRLETQELDILFHPGGENVQMKTGLNGETAWYERSGYKIFAVTR